MIRPSDTLEDDMAHQIDHRILGDDMQIVEIELDPGEVVIAEAGAMCYMDAGISYQAVMGDGSKPASGFMDKLLTAGKRVLTGESLFMTHFRNDADGKRVVAFGGPHPGKIVPLDLATLGAKFTCQKDSFLCAAMGTKVEVAFAKRLAVGVFGGEGFILQRLLGDGKAFIHAGGTVVKKELAGGSLLVDTGCLVGFTDGVTYDIQQAGNLKSMLFGGEGMFLAHLSGTGTVYLQSLPFARLARRVLREAPSRPAGRGEGSLLGGLLGDR
jgi:uncharacterized protein (TIGR00266 family)